jgi:putative membrane protein
LALSRLVWGVFHVSPREGITVRVVLDAIRGALIGAVEIVPGVSGGTMALILRVYQMIIRSASGVVRGLVGLVAPRVRSQQPWSDVEWARIIPLLVGMFVAIFVAARFLEPLISEYPVQARALFAGAILVSLVIPARMVGARWRLSDVVVAGVATTISFILVGIPQVTVEDPAPWIVAPAAALAVCALVLPGVSGSFLLLAMGMYEPTLRAVNERDVSYLSVFILGAIVGLASFVLVLQWLLTHRRRITLVVMTGLMAGSLRALWPWQSANRDLLTPQSDELLVAVGLFLVGAGVVAIMLWGEKRVVPQHATLTD